MANRYSKEEKELIIEALDAAKEKGTNLLETAERIATVLDIPRNPATIVWNYHNWRRQEKEKPTEEAAAVEENESNQLVVENDAAVDPTNYSGTIMFDGPPKLEWLPNWHDALNVLRQVAEERDFISPAYESLTKENATLREKLQKMEHRMLQLEEEAHQFALIINRARELAGFGEKQSAAAKFKMTPDGSLERME